MQQPMHSYVCGIKFEVRKFSRFVRFTFCVKRCTRIRQDLVYRAKSKYGLMRILSAARIYTTNVGIHKLLHDIPRFLIFFVEQLFFNYNRC